MADTHHHSELTGGGTGSPVTPGASSRRRRRNRSGGAAPREPIASLYPAPAGGEVPASPVIPIRTVDEARALARDRFRDRVQAGEKVGECDCHSAETATDGGAARPAQGPAVRVAGVRFRDSGRLYYFDATGFELEPGEWVVADTERGQEAGRVILAPHQVLLSQLQGELRPLVRRLSDDDVQLMDRLRRESSTAVRTFSDLIHQHRVPIKPISATFSFDGAHLTLSYAPHQGIERPDLRSLGRSLAQTFGCRVDLRAVSPREEARLLGGLGRCGRTLCCSSWLPVFPEITMGMAKTQDLALNPSKVSGVCGRLLCCLSYENEQYKQLKSVLPRLGQRVETPEGWGQVISLQVLKEQLTVRLEHNGEMLSLAGADLGPRRGAGESAVTAAAPTASVEPAAMVAATGDDGRSAPDGDARRSRWRRNHSPGGASA
jgi:cell fate regulator YaaT (PSP1 superfamily)